MRKTDPARPYIRAFYEKNHLNFALTLLLRMAIVPAMLFVSWVLGEIIDIIGAGDWTRLWNMLKLVIGFSVVITVAEIGLYRAKAAFIRRALVQYKTLAFQGLTGKSISAFSSENTGRYISLLTNDVTTIENDYLSAFFDLCAQPVMFLGTLFFMLWKSPLLTLAAALLCLLPFAGAIAFSPELSRRQKAVSDKNEGFVAKLKDLLAGFAVIKSFKAEGETAAIFETETAALEEVRRRRRWWEGLLKSVSQTLGITMQFGIFFIGAYLALRGDITGGTVLIFVNLCNSLIEPIQTVPQLLAARKAARGLIGKLAEVTRENAARTGEAIEPVLSSAIELNNVTFGYEPEKPVLRDVSLRLEAGKKYALVGASGSGKSTLLNLLMGAQDKYDGELTVDGRELRDIDPDSLYDLISLIGQSVFVFDDTLRRNITMFRDFPEADVDSAVERAGLAPLITERGTDYRCGENGVGLSGGERQRVSIARSLLRGTPVLLLDEATAALDNETAFKVIESILDLEDLTRLVVTHRLEEALLRRYDRIFVLRDGQLAEQGTFEELMGEKGYFYSLYTISGGNSGRV